MAEPGDLEDDLFADLYVPLSTNRGNDCLTFLLTQLRRR